MDCTKENSFHVKEEVTEGRDVMPSTMARAKASTPEITFFNFVDVYVRRNLSKGC